MLFAFKSKFTTLAPSFKQILANDFLDALDNSTIVKSFSFNLLILNTATF